MAEELSDSTSLRLAFRRAHLSTLALLAVCLLVILTREGAEEPSPDRVYTIVALTLGLASVVFQRFSGSPVISASMAVLLGVAGLVFSAALGIVGVVVATTLGAQQTGLLYTLAAGLLCVRPLRRRLPPARPS